MQVSSPDSRPLPHPAWAPLQAGRRALEQRLAEAARAAEEQAEQVQTTRYQSMAMQERIKELQELLEERDGQLNR